MKQGIFEVLEGSPESGRLGRYLSTGLLTLITLNVLAVILETVPELMEQYRDIFNAFEFFSVAVFTVEYLVRIWSCTSQSKYGNAISGRVRYAVSFMAIIDLLAILPFYLPLMFVVDLRMLRALRLLRLMRILKIGRYTDALQILRRTIVAKKEELLVTLFVVVVGLTVTSSLMYFVEHEAQPELFSSIPATMWWCIATLTTVGYGDIYPVTALGKVLGGVVALLGIGLFAMPAAILASGFAETMKENRSS